MPLTPSERAQLDADLQSIAARGAAEVKAVLDLYTATDGGEPEPPEPPTNPADWEFAGNEGAYISVAANTTLRYGAEGHPYCIKGGFAAGYVLVSNETFGGDPVYGTPKHADRWVGSGSPPADTGPINGGGTDPGNGGGNEPPEWTPYPLSWFPAAPGPAPLTDPQHHGNFGWLWANDGQHRLAAHYCSSGDGGMWYQRNHLDLANQYFGGSTGQMGYWRNLWTAGEPTITNEEQQGLGRMQGY